MPELERVVTKVPSKLMSLHLKYDCPERPVRCSLCLKDVKAKLSAVHAMQDCGKRPVSCRVEVMRISSNSMRFTNQLNDFPIIGMLENFAI